MIPIDPKFTTNAQLTPANYAVSLSLLEHTRQKEAFVPMQFNFVSQPVWKVDLRTGNPNPPLEKITNVYIDALNSTHDVIVYFPDTGYQVHVGAGTCFMCPTLIAKNTFVFYVTLLGQVISATDFVNIFAMNVTVPYFDTLWQYPNGLNGNKSHWFFVGSSALADIFSFYGDYGQTRSLIDYNNDFQSPILFQTTNNFFLKDILISFTLMGQVPPSPPAGLYSINIKLFDGSNTIFDQNFTNTQNGTVANADYFNVNINNVNYTSSTNALTFKVSYITGAPYYIFTNDLTNKASFNFIYDAL